MIHYHLIEVAESQGFEALYSATIAATRGNNGPLAQFGIFGVDVESAHRLCKMIERAWLGRSLSLATAAITKAKGGAYAAR